jgi:hypothetical protein
MLLGATVTWTFSVLVRVTAAVPDIAGFKMD